MNEDNAQGFAHMLELEFERLQTDPQFRREYEEWLDKVNGPQEPNINHEVNYGAYSKKVG